MKYLLAFLVLLLVSSPIAAEETVSGKPTVVDGGKLYFPNEPSNRQNIYLAFIRPFWPGQRCVSNFEKRFEEDPKFFDAGQAAKEFLEALVSKGEVTCEIVKSWKQGSFGDCRTASGEFLSDRMIETGNALSGAMVGDRMKYLFKLKKRLYPAAQEGLKGNKFPTSCDSRSYEEDQAYYHNPYNAAGVDQD